MKNLIEQPLSADFSPARRNWFKHAGLLAGIAGLGLASQQANAMHHDEHAHHQHTVDSGRERLIEHASDCIKKGQACSAHCMDLFRMGDTTVAACADSVQEMLAACTALSQLAAYDSKHLKDMVKVCIGICQDCEKECRKHEKKHAECRACANSCSDCIKVCQDYLA